LEIEFTEGPSKTECDLTGYLEVESTRMVLLISSVTWLVLLRSADLSGPSNVECDLVGT